MTVFSCTEANMKHSSDWTWVAHEDVKAWYTELAGRLYLGHGGWRPAGVDHARKPVPGAAICRPDPPRAAAPGSGIHAWLPCHPTGGLGPAAAPTLSWLSSAASSPAALQPHMPLCQQALNLDSVTRPARSAGQRSSSNEAQHMPAFRHA